MTVAYGAREAIELAMKIAREPGPAPASAEVHVVPDDLREFLARLRLLESVPFAYLVPDSDLLPLGSIRFFYIDRSWTDALVEGVLSVGTVSTADRAQLQRVYDRVRVEVDEEERHVRMPLGEPPLTGPGSTITGFLLRSRAVSGWPGLHVRGFRSEPATEDDDIVPEDHPSRVKLLRMEQPAPAVLLVLFDGIPEVVYIEEPRSGIQFGVHLTGTGTPNHYGATTKPRDAKTAKETADPEAPVPFRSGAPGVVDVGRLGADLKGIVATHMDTLDGATFAVEMLRFPYRQVFGNPHAAPHAFLDVFKPVVAVDDLVTKYTQVLHP